MRSGISRRPKCQVGTDIARFDVAVVDAEIEDERYFGDEQQTEEKRQPAQQFLTAFLKRNIIDLINARAERVECRRHDNAGDDWIEAESWR